MVDPYTWIPDMKGKGGGISVRYIVRYEVVHRSKEYGNQYFVITTKQQKIQVLQKYFKIAKKYVDDNAKEK